LRGEIVVAAGAGRGMQRLGGVVGDWVVGQRGPGIAIPVQAIGQAARRASGQRRGDPRAGGALALQRGAVGRVGRGLRAEDERGAHLHRVGTQRQRGGDAGAVHDAAGGDQRQAGLPRQQAHQRQGADPVVAALRVENPAMAAGLDALGDQCIDPRGLGQRRFRRRGDAGHQADAGALQRSDGRRRGQAEVEAHHRRALVQQHLEHRRIGQEASVYLAQCGWRRGVELGEQRPQVVQPGRLPRGVGLRGRVAEQVDVERPRGQRAGFADQRSCLLRGVGAHAQRAQPAGLGHRRRQAGRGDAGHRRLDDRMFYAQQGGEARTHGVSSGGAAAGSSIRR